MDLKLFYKMLDNEYINTDDEYIKHILNFHRFTIIFNPSETKKANRLR